MLLFIILIRERVKPWLHDVRTNHFFHVAGHQIDLCPLSNLVIKHREPPPLLRMDHEDVEDLPLKEDAKLSEGHVFLAALDFPLLLILLQSIKYCLLLYCFLGEQVVV